MSEMSSRSHIVALSGGVGGARMVCSLWENLPDNAQLSVIVNTADDFEHWGLPIWPDLDTVMYNLAGLSHPEQGWGIKNESFTTFAAMAERGESDWFRLGDKDLATHLIRSRLLAQGLSKTEVTTELCRRYGVKPALLPMSDEPVSTYVDTSEGELDFQTWLVRKRAKPTVHRVWQQGGSTPSQAALDALKAADLVVLTPSNPYVSLLPITQLEGMSEALAQKPVVGVSPLVGGKAFKGPLAEMIRSLGGEEPGPAAVAKLYQPWLDGFLVAPGDGFELGDLAVQEGKIHLKTREERKAAWRSLAGLVEEVLQKSAKSTPEGL